MHRLPQRLGVTEVYVAKAFFLVDFAFCNSTKRFKGDTQEFFGDSLAGVSMFQEG